MQIWSTASAAQSVTPSLMPEPTSSLPDEAWWTGPLVAKSPQTLPVGHFLIEPYIYDVHQSSSDSLNSTTFLFYGLFDRFTIGLTPSFSYNLLKGGGSSTRIGLGDVAVSAMYRLTKRGQPTVALEIVETLPTGRYDRLDGHPGNGFGGGVYSTEFLINSQISIHAPTGRPLRLRLNLSFSTSGQTSVTGASVYGTGSNFRGRVAPGNVAGVDIAGEYSFTKRWVFAVDGLFSHANTMMILSNEKIESLSASTSFGLAPAIEYNWSSRAGVLIGSRHIFSGPHTTESTTVITALNYVF